MWQPVAAEDFIALRRLASDLDRSIALPDGRWHMSTAPDKFFFTNQLHGPRHLVHSWTLYDLTDAKEVYFDLLKSESGGLELAFWKPLAYDKPYRVGDLSVSKSH